MKTIASLVLTDIDKIVLLVLFVLLVLSLVLLILAIMHKGHFKKALNRHIKNNEYNVRIYKLDYRLNQISYFDRKRMSKKMVETLESFYKQFPDSDQANVKAWIENNIKNNEKASDYLETKVYLKRNNEIGSALYELTSINRFDKIMHFESYLLPYLAYGSTKKAKKVRNYIKTLNDIQAYTEKHHLKGKGGTLLIKLFSTHSYELDSETIKPLMLQLVNHIGSLLNSDRFLVFLSDSEIAIFDFEITNRATINGLGNTLKQLTEGFLTINSLDDNYEISIGMVLNEAGMDIKTIISRAREMAILAEQAEDNGFELFDSEKDYANIVSSQPYQELMTLQKNNTFRYYFTPMIDIAKRKVRSYLLSIEPYGTEFEDIDDVLEAANELRLLHPIFRTIISSVIQQIGAVDEKTEILINAKVNYVNDYNVIKNSLEVTNLAPTLLFTEEDLLSYADEYDDLEILLNSLIEKGFNLALTLDNETIELSETLILKFKYFLAKEQSFKDDDRKLVFIKTLFDQYEKYDGEFGVVGLESLSDLQIVSSLGIELVTCQEFLDASSTIEELDEDKEEKLVKLTSNH